MNDLVEIKEEILEIIKEYKVGPTHPLSISELMLELEEFNTGLVRYAVMSPTLDGKIAIIGSENGPLINKMNT